MKHKDNEVIMNSPRTICTPILVTATCLFSACSEQEQAPTQTAPQQLEASVSVDIIEAEQEFWQAVSEYISVAIESSNKLKADIDTLLTTPSQNTLSAAQQSLAQTQLDFAKLRGLQLLQISSPEIFTVGANTLNRILAHPIQPGYLDRFGPYQYSGLVFDIGFDLDAGSLIQQHGLTDSEEVVLGLYAMEFMLFGEGGGRSAQDYLETKKLTEEHRKLQLSNVMEIPNNRRRKLLELQTEQLLKDASYLKQLFLSISTRDMRRWKALSAQQQISKIRSSLDTGITQSLISLADIQNALISNKEGDIAQPDQVDVVHSPANSVSKLIAEISSLLSMTSYLSDIEKTAADSALSQSLMLLCEVDVNNEAETQKQLKDIYETLRSAL